METEARFYYACDSETEIVHFLKKMEGLEYKGRFFEVTQQFNHPMKEFDFYDKKIDGRMRVRRTEGKNEKRCMISWKQRASGGGGIHQEKEVEVEIRAGDYEGLEYLFLEVLHLKLVESYERYRNVFVGKGIEVVVDRYPFGVAVEIEDKSRGSMDARENVEAWATKLGFDLEDAYRLSWDDKYKELCEEQGVECCKNVTFEKEMPEIDHVWAKRIR